MADKPTLNTLSGNSRLSVTELNENFDTLASAIEGCLGRGGIGESPNSMSAALDMNSNKIQNLATPTAANDAARLTDVQDAVLPDIPIPSQTGNAGKLLETNGTTLAWGKVYDTAKTNDTLVLRDGSGAAALDVTGDVTGNVTGNLTGDVTGDVTGNVTGNLTGDVTGDVTGNSDTATTATLATTVTSATQAEQEAGTDTDTAVTPSVQHYHPSAAKAWVKFAGKGTVSIDSSYNVTSITDNGVGDYTVNLTTAFSSADYTAFGWARRDSTQGNEDAAVSPAYDVAPTSSAFRVNTRVVTTLGAEDAETVYITFFGDQ